MARYKPYNLQQSKFIPLSYADQVVPGSFEYALNEIVEEHLDLGVCEPRYGNDEAHYPERPQPAAGRGVPRMSRDGDAASGLLDSAFGCGHTIPIRVLCAQFRHQRECTI